MSLAAADAGPLHAFRVGGAVGCLADTSGAAAISDRRCRAAPRVSRRLDLDAPVQQRHHQRRRRVDRCGGGADRARATARPAWDRLLAMLPSVAEQFRSARPTLSFVHAPRLAFRSARVVGPAWALLPSAAGVIDPLLSTGFPLTLLGLLRLLDLLERTAPGADREAALAEYERASARRTGRDRAAGRRAVRDDERSGALQAAQPAVFRGRELQRGRPADSDGRNWRRGFLLCAAPGVRPGGRGLRRARIGIPSARARETSCWHGSIAPSIRSTQPASSIAGAATGIPCWRPTFRFPQRS